MSEEKPFQLNSHFKPSGDQPQAIESLVNGLNAQQKFQTLLGVTGSGKTFTMASVIAKTNRPTLVLAHNKTLAAQLVTEFREFFPNNAVEYFVSYYDYYQPEAYLPNSDTYIEKEATINQEIDKLRHGATQSLLSRSDVIVVASVSAIYGLGSPEEYVGKMMRLKIDDEITRETIIRRLVDMQYERTNMTLERGKFRARGTNVEIVPIGQDNIYYRLTIESNRLMSIEVVDLLHYKTQSSERELWLFPAKHYVISPRSLEVALEHIDRELEKRLKELLDDGRLLEADRLERRTRYDMEMIREVGYCNGIENYSMHFDGRQPGQPPYTLIDYFPDDYLLMIDESHVTIPQLQGMYEGDKSRKNTLIEHGFRLPSAKENRPLKFDEFLSHINQAIFVSATPGPFESEHSTNTAEQIVRPTGLVDPEIEIRPIEGQIEDLHKEITKRIAKKERTLVTTLTKKMAEDLSEYLKTAGIKVKYLHSEVETLDRIRILQDLRLGKVDVIVGVNLLREGLDLPEVSLVAILDADKEGFLRSQTSLIQTIGRVARNSEGRVILYADNVTGSMRRAIDETDRRRKIQLEYNLQHNITPKTIEKNIKSILVDILAPDDVVEKKIKQKDMPALIAHKENLMRQAAEALRFEEAAILRDEVKKLKKISQIRY